MAFLSAGGLAQSQQNTHTHTYTHERTHTHATTHKTSSPQLCVCGNWNQNWSYLCHNRLWIHTDGKRMKRKPHTVKEPRCVWVLLTHTAQNKSPQQTHKKLWVMNTEVIQLKWNVLCLQRRREEGAPSVKISCILLFKVDQVKHATGMREKKVRFC